MSYDHYPRHNQYNRNSPFQIAPFHTGPMTALYKRPRGRNHQAAMPNRQRPARKKHGSP